MNVSTRSRSSMEGTAAGTLPLSRKAMSVVAANSRMAACCSGVRPPWSSIMRAGSMRRSSWRSEKSRVTRARAGSSAGRSVTSRAARMKSSSAAMGWTGLARAMAVDGRARAWDDRQMSDARDDDFENLDELDDLDDLDDERLLEEEETDLYRS